MPLSREGAQTRLRIAQLAARMMAEDGIRDHALAKRKAARQLGAGPAHGLPSNEEIDDEIRAYVALFEPESQGAWLADLRLQAIEVMVTLERFEPVLTGALAQGVVSRHAAIELEVQADSSKEFEQFLLNRDIDFKVEDRRGEAWFTLFADPADVIVRVIPETRAPLAGKAGGEPRRRLTIDQLRRLVAES